MNSTGTKNPESIATEPSHSEEKQFFENWCREHNISTTPTRATAILAALRSDLAIVRYLHKNYSTRLDYLATLEAAREYEHLDTIEFLELAYQKKKSLRAKHALRVVGLFGSRSKGCYDSCRPFQEGHCYDASNEDDIDYAIHARHWSWIYHQLVNPLFDPSQLQQVLIFIHSLYSLGVDLSEHFKHPINDYHPRQPATKVMLRGAAQLGWDIYQLCLHSYRAEDDQRPLPSGLINAAAHGGNLELVQWCHEHHDQGYSSKLMDEVALNGHLAVVEFLHRYRTEGCTTDAMDQAAVYGHLAVVEFLHRHRGEGCTMHAMNGAASEGHLRVVEFLHRYRGEGCTIHAMEFAAQHGHLSVVEFLHVHRGEGCSVLAVDWAAQRGHLRVVEFLYRHRTEGGTARAMDWAALRGHLPVVEFLYQHYLSQCNLESALERARESSDNDAVISYLQAAIEGQEEPGEGAASPGQRGAL